MKNTSLVAKPQMCHGRLGGWTVRPTDTRADLLIEIRGRIWKFKDGITVSYIRQHEPTAHYDCNEGITETILRQSE